MAAKNTKKCANPNCDKLIKKDYEWCSLACHEATGRDNPLKVRKAD